MFLLKSKIRSFQLVPKKDFNTGEPFDQPMIQVEYEENFQIRMLSIKVDKENQELQNAYKSLVEKEVYIPLRISVFKDNSYYATRDKPLFLKQA